MTVAATLAIPARRITRRFPSNPDVPKLAAMPRRFPRPVLFAALVAALVAVVQPAAAQELARDGRTELGTFSITHENDLFAGTDRYYTSGLRLSWLSPEGEDIWAPLALVQGVLESVAQDYDRDRTRFGWALGQDIYTPEDRFRTDLVTDDRPYAGWLYGALSLHTITEDDADPAKKVSESVELALGVVGPEALGEEAQDFIHDVRLIEVFHGWDNQLKTEPGLMLSYERKWRHRDPVPHLDRFEADFIPRVGASIGNVVTQAGLGAAVRFGYNLPRDFGPPGLIHGSEPLSALDTRPFGPFSLYAFLTADGRFVAHNIFLDGNTFRSSHSVEREPWVADFTAGVAVVYDRFTIAYTNAVRTKEFDGQRRASRFGSISVSFQAFF